MNLPAEKIKVLNLLIKPTAFLDYRDFLRSIYAWLKGESDKYSYLQFAQDFGFSKTNVLHLIVQGKRPLTLKASEKIIQTLDLTGTQRVYFEKMVQYQNARDPKEREDHFQKMLAMKSKSLGSETAKAQLEFFSEWYHPAIYELVALPSFDVDPKWIADRLKFRIRPEQARKSLQLLETLKFIRFNSQTGRYEHTHANITTGDEIASVAVIRYHQKLIEMGKESITLTKEDERDISAITVSVSQETAQRLKAEIQTFRKRLLALAEESKNKEEVYQMNIQFFPLTK